VGIDPPTPSAFLAHVSTNLASVSPLRKDVPIFGPKRSNRFFAISSSRISLQVSLKNIGDCKQSHNGLNGTALDPPLFSGLIIPLIL
jgi:hypothetical protein